MEPTVQFLIIEDEGLIADLIEEIVRRAGHSVWSACGSLDKAEELVGKAGFGAAILDANLRGHSTNAIARQLRQRQIPFVVISGYDRAELQSELARAPFIRKPFQPSELLDAIVRVGIPQ